MSAPSAPSPLARRVGTPLAVASLVVTAVVLTWLAVAPTAIAGTVAEVGVTVPATLVLPPDDAGCLVVVDGDGGTTELCSDALVVDEREHHGWRDARVEQDGTVTAWVETGEVQRVVRLDLATGEELEVETFDPDRDDFWRRVEAPMPPAPLDEAIVVAEGDRVVRYPAGRVQHDGAGEVLLDLQGPPGWVLRDTALSPDGAWVVAQTPDDRVVVAPVDGSAPPATWVETDVDRWLDLRGAIRWDDPTP